jgi:triacylglycerol lipase
MSLGCAGASDDADPSSAGADMTAVAPLGAEPTGTAARYPIVLASGFGTSPTYNTFKNLPAALEKDGHRVWVADLPPFYSTAVRGAALAKEIDKALAKFGAAKVNIIAHSSGGTDAREVVSILGYGDRVASLTTISSAHGGSPLADLIVNHTSTAFDDALDALLGLVGAKFSDVAGNSHFRAGFESITVANAPSFNAHHPDDPRVFYQSWAGVAGLFGSIDARDDIACEGKRFGDKRVNGVVHPALAAMALAMRGQSQDALVPVEHAKHGVFRGCIPTDHLAEIGGSESDPEMAPHSGFDHVRFYRLMAYELAGKGL